MPRFIVETTHTEKQSWIIDAPDREQAQAWGEFDDREVMVVQYLAKVEFDAVTVDEVIDAETERTS